MSTYRMRTHGLVIKIGNDYTGDLLLAAKNRLVGRFYTEKQINDIMDPLKSDDSRAAGICVSTRGTLLYKFSTTPHSNYNLIELLGIAENTEEGLKELTEECLEEPL